MSRKNENSTFICAHCGTTVVPLTNGSYRNHCPHCLYSLHVDNVPGDRSSSCGGLMQPVGFIYHSKKGYQIRHRCVKCGTERINRIAENTLQPDDLDVTLGLMRHN
jgi:DNA-directed RNA polymerase subunit RPC12/RpoP